ncbi:hypothetical protein OPIT5_13070 [Opitutaceae bacterium TAV5]|nr:hypothetical protein OPIT5_13070 [Opitutaceae bacterium TAV5]
MSVITLVATLFAVFEHEDLILQGEGGSPAEAVAGTLPAPQPASAAWPAVGDIAIEENTTRDSGTHGVFHAKKSPVSLAAPARELPGWLTPPLDRATRVRRVARAGDREPAPVRDRIVGIVVLRL